MFGPSRGAYFHPRFSKHDNSQYPQFNKKYGSEMEQPIESKVNQCLSKLDRAVAILRPQQNSTPSELSAELSERSSQPKIDCDGLCCTVHLETQYNRNNTTGSHGLDWTISKSKLYIGEGLEVTKHSENTFVSPNGCGMGVNITPDLPMVKRQLHFDFTLLDCEPLPLHVSCNLNEDVSSLFDRVGDLLVDTALDDNELNTRDVSDGFPFSWDFDIEPTPLLESSEKNP